MPFAKMGVDSLMAVQMVKSLERTYEIRLYPTLLFEMKTVDELAAHLEKESPVSTPEPVPVPAPVAQGHEAWMVGKEEGLSLSKMPLRAPGEGEIEVVVRAVGVNFIDILASVGMHPQIRENAFVPGHEVSGVVVATGPNTSAFRPGDRVMAVTPSGGYATRAILPAATTLPLPANLTFEEGASILITGITAVACLEHYGRLQAGEKILIQAAAGATGLACVQLAGHIGATIFGTSSAPEKLARLRSLGVSYPINYREVDFADEVRRITDGAGVDVVVDSLSGDAIGKGLDLLKPGGRFIEIGAAGVVEVPGVDPTKLFLKNQQFMAVNVMQLSENPALLDRLRNRLLELLREGILTPSIGHRLPFRDAEKAHRLIRERKNTGKIVLLVDPGQKEGSHVGSIDA
jgi:myxalamid-type polyketide synthase MxaE and MxaD